MRTVMIIAAIVIVGFTAFQVVVTTNTNNTKKYEYTVVKELDGVEIRTYPEAVFAKVELDKADYKTMSGKGFRVLADYIFGNNQEDQKISMTSPVLMEMNETYTMEFMMPSKYNKDSLPTPNNSKIELTTRPEWKAACLEFGGFADDQKIEHKIEALKQVLEKEGIEHKGNFKFLGYNPPYQLVGRRNEVVVELK